MRKKKASCRDLSRLLCIFNGVSGKNFNPLSKKSKISSLRAGSLVRARVRRQSATHTAVYSVVTRDYTKNGCVADYSAAEVSRKRPQARAVT